MLGELVGLNPNKNGSLRRKPSNLVAQLEDLTELVYATVPEENTLEYWLKRLSALRRNGHPLEEIEKSLELQKGDLEMVFQKCQSMGLPQNAGVAVCIGCRTAQATKASVLASVGYTLSDDYSFMQKAITNKNNFFLFSNSVLVGMEGCFDPNSTQDLRSTVNQACEDLFRAQPPFASMYLKLNSAVQTDILIKTGVTITN